MNTFTIGFTQKKASVFFGLLRTAGIASLIDVRLNNVSQLAGFAKRDDLMFFLKELCQVDYCHLPELAPTKPLLSAYKKGDIDWQSYEDQFLNLMAQRHVEKLLEVDKLENACLLCSEHQPHHCHRRLVVDYLNEHWNSSLQVTHLV